MLKYSDDFNKYLSSFKINSCEKIPIYASISDTENTEHNKLKTQISLLFIKGDNQYTIYIENFQTFEGNFSDKNRNKGYGSLLLNKLTDRMSELGLLPSITEIKGSLEAKDKAYWQISMPMYLKFARGIFGCEPICTIADESINLETFSQAMQIIKRFCSCAIFSFKKP